MKAIEAKPARLNKMQSAASPAANLAPSFPMRRRNGVAIQRACAACKDQKEELRRMPTINFITPTVQAKRDSGVASDLLATSIQSAKGGGTPLDEKTSEYMGSRFGADFSDTRIHTGNYAVQMSKDLNAHAFTVGKDIFFNEGKYNPNSSSGKHLLAHELTHTLQQNGGNLQKERIQRVGPAAAAAGGAAVGLVLGAVSFEAALDYAQSLSTRYPGWLGTLPNCPCNEASVLADPASWEQDKNPILSWFHPGAASSYRSKSTFVSVPGTSHGQQCTYNSSGGLITEGPGAGTPDVWSPNTHGGDHFLYDAATWQVLGWRIYNRYWQPNNGNGCPASRGENNLMRRFSEFIP